MIDEIKASFETLMREYPSGMRVNSLLASKNFGIKQEYIIVGNGAAELIKAYMENWTGKLGNIIPTFEEYPNRLDSKNLIQFVPSAEGFTYTAEDIKHFFADKDIDTLLLINPDNPSGNYIPFSDLLGLIDWTKEKGLKFIVDESFVDFAKVDGAFSLFDNSILSNNPHLTVVKSISKSYGVPGFRLGVLASGNAELIKILKKQVAIWNINSFGEFFMQIFEKYQKDYEKACELFREERDHFYKKLITIPYFTVYPSQANYFLCKVKEKYTSHELALKLLNHNILIKDCSTKKSFDGKNYIRLAVRDRKDNNYLVDILEKL
jgi:histidinol-phosphate/aromatic aminotransferase/cobyric acid decarboxylase-like protein